MRLPLGWLQLKRDRLRFLVGVLGVMFAVVLVFMQLGFRDALFTSAVRFHEHLIADLVLINPQSEFLTRMQPFARRRLYQTEAVPGVASVSAVYTSIAMWRNLETRASRLVLVVGFDPGEPVLDLPDVTRQLETLRHPDVVLFDEASRPEYGPVAARVRGGEAVSVEVERRRVTVGGLFPLGTSFGIDGTLITSDLNFLRILRGLDKGAIHIGLIRLVPGADREAVRALLAATLPPDVAVLGKEAYLEREKTYWRKTTPIGFIFAFGCIMGLAVGAIIVYQILFTDVTSHLAEYATLKAIGYRNGYLFSVVLQEALILAVLGYLPGLLLCVQLYRLTERATRLPMHFGIATSLTVLLLTIGMCMLAGAITLRKVQAADPAEIF